MFRRALLRASAMPARPTARFISSLDHETLPDIRHVVAPLGVVKMSAEEREKGAANNSLKIRSVSERAKDATADEALEAFTLVAITRGTPPTVVNSLYEAVVRHAETLNAQQAAKALHAAAMLGLCGTRGVVALEKAVARTAGELQDPRDYAYAAAGAYGLRLVRLALGPLKSAAARLGVPIRGDVVKLVPEKGEMSLWQAIEAHKREQPALSVDQKEVHKESEWTT